MKQPRDISLGKGWTVRFEDGDMPVHIEYRKGTHVGTASLGFFEENYSTSCDAETPAPQSVIDAFEANADIIYAWEDDWFRRNSRED
jgi:hypothetical protein